MLRPTFALLSSSHALLRGACALTLASGAVAAPEKQKPPTVVVTARAATFNEAAARAIIEQKLRGTLPKASDASLAEAVGEAVEDQLRGALPPDLPLADIVQVAVAQRAASTPGVLAIVRKVSEVIFSLTSGEEAGAALERVTNAACFASQPGSAVQIVQLQIELAAQVPEPPRQDAPILMEDKPVLAAEVYVEKIISGAIKALRRAPTPNVARDVDAIAAVALRTAPAYLTLEAAAGVARSSAAGGLVLSPLSGGANNLTKTMLGAVPDTQESAGAVVAGVLRARGDGVALAVKSEAAAAKPAFANYTGAVVEGYRLVEGGSGNFSVLWLEKKGAEFDRAALVLGAVANAPADAPRLTREALNHAESTPTLGIVAAGVRAAQRLAPETTAAAIGAAGATVSDIAQGAVEAAHWSVAGDITGQAIAGLQPVSVDAVKLIVNGAITAARKTGKERALPLIAFRAAQASRFAKAVADVALAAAEGPARILAGIGPVAADITTSAEVSAHVKAALESNPAQQAAFVSGATAATGVQAQMRNFFTITTAQLAAARTREARLATVYGAGFANPRGVAVIAAAAMAAAGEEEWDGIVAAALDINPTRKQSIVAATDAVRFIRRGGRGDAAGYVEQCVAHRASQIVAVAAGAVIAAPESAHLIARAVGLRAGKSAVAVVPAMFAFSQLDQFSLHKVASRGAAAAQLTNGFLSGIVEAKLPDERAVVTATLGAAVRSAISLDSAAAESASASATPLGAVDALVESSLRAGGTTEAVIRSSVDAAKTHGLAIARASAQGLAYITDGTFTDAGELLSQAVKAGGGLNFSGTAATPAEIRQAIDFGIAERNSLDLGAVTGGAVNYSHAPGTNPAVRAMLDL